MARSGLAVRWSIEDRERGEGAAGVKRTATARSIAWPNGWGSRPSSATPAAESSATAPETKRRLLAAMGVEAADEATAAGGARRHCDRAEWLRPLAPVQVVRTDAGARRS